MAIMNKAKSTPEIVFVIAILQLKYISLNQEFGYPMVCVTGWRVGRDNA
jgi:hypothetical protein